jgi:hypothetical protein
MKTISLTLEQTKKSKKGNSLVSLRTKAAEYKDTEAAENICKEFILAIRHSLMTAQEMGATSIKVGNVNFSLRSKFVLYVDVNGQTYSLDDVFSIFEGTNKTEVGFRNTKALFVAIYQIIRTAEGKSPLLTDKGTKERNAIEGTKLLIETK